MVWMSSIASWCYSGGGGGAPYMFSQSRCNLLFLWLLLLFYALCVICGRTACILPTYSGLWYDFSTILCHLWKPPSAPKGWSLWKSSWIGDGISSCLREFSPLFQLFNNSGKGFCRIGGTHHLQCVPLKINLVGSSVAGEQMLQHV